MDALYGHSGGEHGGLARSIRTTCPNRNRGMGMVQLPTHAQDPQETCCPSLESQAVSAIACARLERTRLVAVDALPVGNRLKEGPTSYPIMERLAVEAGALATRVGVMWIDAPMPLGDRYHAMDALAADSARGALADARTPLTPEAVSALALPPELLTDRGTQEWEDPLEYIRHLTVLAFHVSGMGKAAAVTVDKAVAGLTGADKIVYADAVQAAYADAEHLVEFGADG